MTPTQREVLVAQLIASRMMAEAMVSQMDAALALIGPPTNGTEADECAHPSEAREDLTTMGGPLEWRCRICGFHSTTEQPTEG